MSKFKVGDVVRVWKPANTDQFPYWGDGMDRFHGTEQTISRINTLDHTVEFAENSCSCNYFFHFDWLEPCTDPAVEPAQPEWSWVPKGHTVIEMAVPDSLAKKIGAGNALVWEHRKEGKQYLTSVNTDNNGVNLVSTANSDGLLFVPTVVSTTPPVSQYREPTSADVGKIVEVKDSKDGRWNNFELLAVIQDENILERFVCRDPGDALDSINWKYAQIRIEEGE
jgi:hypothetical protein